MYPVHSGTRIERIGEKDADVIITGRPYQEVVKSLALNQEEQQEGKIFLSLGDGLSDFAPKFEEDTGATVITSDPIYKVIHPLDSTKEAKDKVAAAGLEGIKITSNPKKIPSPEAREHAKVIKRKGANVVVDVRALPFADKTLDGIFSAHALRYIDLTQCIAEFVRVLKDSGEMRFGHPGFEAVFTDQEVMVYPDKKHADKYRNKLILFLENFSEELHYYVLINQAENSSAGTVQTLVVSRKDEIPRFTSSVAEGVKQIVARINPKDIKQGGLLSWKAEMLNRPT